MIKIRNLVSKHKKKKMFFKISTYHKDNIYKVSNNIKNSRFFNIITEKSIIVNLPKSYSLITVLKSPHVYKKARRQLGKVTYNKIYKQLLIKKNFLIYQKFFNHYLYNDIGCLCKLYFKY